MPLHVMSPFMEDKDRAIKRKAIDALGKGAWVWETETGLPPLPAARELRTARSSEIDERLDDVVGERRASLIVAASD